MKKPRKAVRSRASKCREMPLANQQQPEHFIFMDSKEYWQGCSCRDEGWSEAEPLGKRRQKKIKGDTGAKGIECRLRENPQDW